MDITNSTTTAIESVTSTIFATLTNTAAMANSTFSIQNSTSHRDDKNHNAEFYFGATLCVAVLIFITSAICYISKRSRLRRLQEQQDMSSFNTSAPSTPTTSESSFQLDLPPDYGSISQHPILIDSLPPSYVEAYRIGVCELLTRMSGELIPSGSDSGGRRI